MFIDNILVAINTEEEHDKLVEEVLRRLEENNLFVKLEKCKWKVREVELLGVVIGLKEVEMQKEKIEGVLNWPAPRNVKEVQKFLDLMLQTSFGYISINSSMILTVLMTTESPQKNLLINTNHVQDN